VTDASAAGLDLEDSASYRNREIDFPEIDNEMDILKASINKLSGQIKQQDQEQ